jgi:hypothetical protein
MPQIGAPPDGTRRLTRRRMNAEPTSNQNAAVSGHRRPLTAARAKAKGATLPRSVSVSTWGSPPTSATASRPPPLPRPTPTIGISLGVRAGSGRSKAATELPVNAALAVWTPPRLLRGPRRGCSSGGSAEGLEETVEPRLGVGAEINPFAAPLRGGVRFRSRRAGRSLGQFRAREDRGSGGHPSRSGP